MSDTVIKEIGAEDSEFEILLRQRQINDEKVNELDDENWQITKRICEIKGNCPKCKNTHYPHC